MTHATLTIDGKSMPVSNFTTTLPGLSYVKVSTAFLSHIAMEGRFKERCRKTLAEYEESATGEIYNSPALNDAIAAARAALARAKGETT